MYGSQFIKELKTNKQSREELDQFKKEEMLNYRQFTSYDRYKIGLNVVFFETKGKGEREVLQKIHYCKGDTGLIGEYWGEIYLHGDGLSLPRKFKLKSHRILIKKDI